MTKTSNTKISIKLRAIYIALLVNVALLGDILGCLFALFTYLLYSLRQGD